MDIKQYAVIGLGRFGTSIARKLHDAGQEVLGIDVIEERVEDAELYVTHAVVADSTEEKALTSLEIGNFDCVIIAIGNDLQANILTAMLLKDLGVKKIIAKALEKRHGELLKKIGVDWIVYPERDMGERVGNQLLSPNLLNYIELSKEYNIEEIMIPQSMAEKTFRELDIRAEYNVNAIALIRDGTIHISPSADEVIHQNDVLVLLGKTEDLANFSKKE
ncbi:potassium channel family protein [Rummeliibacillus pycnus]|uniref:potassium channel family protein n=1 Tax=Rummeliibacillus pycnus TaxID=101070 RepID=UPI000C9B58B0|nr:TrkA family potassium uptake protein [Rummeliibacillus pycnus]